MIVGGVVQQPDEVLDYDFLYADWFAGLTDTVASVTAEVIPSGELTATAVKSADTEIKVWVAGGVSGNTYMVEVTTTTTAGRIKQDELSVLVEEF